MHRSLPLTLLLTCTTSVAGQQLPPPIPGLTSNTPASMPTTAFGHPGDYRLEGLIAGAVLIGGAATFLVVGLCGSSDSCESSDAILIGLGSIALGALTGALIGGAIPKAPPTSSTEAALPQRANEGLRPAAFREHVIDTRCCWRDDASSSNTTPPGRLKIEARSQHEITWYRQRPLMRRRITNLYVEPPSS